ncbi:MAG TPA: UV DNA damage repair endonuclease UvsE [Candidatus Thermoplasmatota archaeon]|nr:UV DNA damage repair endonuclease UvsE [Candidatus Thermoplasmatota archaeon]
MRLGYACMNTTLGTKSRTCRLANATPERVAELARENLADARRMAQWNAEHGIGLLRLTSGMVPFGGLPVSGDWREALAEDFAATGDVFRETGMRVSTHPGQYVVLNSPKAHVVEAAIKDLEYHADFLEAMGVNGDMVIHLGGAYGEKEAALDRFVETALALPEKVRRRLVLENDDVTWNAVEVLEAARRTRLPMVFDPFHDSILASGSLTPHQALARALATWPEDRIPKIHYSDQAPGKVEGTHADLVDAEAFHAFRSLARGLRDFDVMVEAKHKELAVLPLLAALQEARAEA